MVNFKMPDNSITALANHGKGGHLSVLLIRGCAFIGLSGDKGGCSPSQQTASTIHERWVHMRSDTKSHTTTLETLIHFLVLIGLTLLLAMLTGICGMPADSAWGTVIEQPGHQQAYEGVDPISRTTNQEDWANAAPNVKKKDYTFTDENTGITILHYDAGSTASTTEPGSNVAPESRLCSWSAERQLFTRRERARHATSCARNTMLVSLNL